ncbi:MAG TPA: hypothetical protein VLL51_00375, partial [Gemmatimonadales bacterium]|nr:hypothetical protein [Gemmatimonadales bacterium]
MVASVPGVLLQQVVEVQHPELGVVDGALEVRLGQRFEQGNPPGVKRGQEVERRGDRTAGVRQFGPAGLLVRLDPGLGLGQSQLEPDIGVEVAVGQV